MSDDARLQRLTVLARKVWPDFGPLTVELRHSGATVQIHNENQFQAVIFDHPRALDALEAALLVLSGESEPSIDLTQLPAYIELQKRLALAEAKLEAVLKVRHELLLDFGVLGPLALDVAKKLDFLLDDQ